MKEIEELTIAMRAKVGMCWVQSSEEVRIERMLMDVASTLEYKIMVWSATSGLTDPTEPGNKKQETRDPAIAMTALLNMNGRVAGVFLDLGAWLRDPMTLRTAKDVHRKLVTLERDAAKQIIVIDRNAPPDDLVGVSVIDWPLPDRETMEAVVDSITEWAPEKAGKDLKKNDNRNKIVSAMLGLSTEAGATALTRSLAACGTFDPTRIAKEKQRVVKGSGLEWYDPDPRGLEGVGGLDVLKDWLVERRLGFSAAARKYGLQAPRGVLLLGVPGGGKSLIAKCIASAWSLPLLRMDVGALFSKFVGESEGKIRTALSTAEAVAPCIMWVDEIEKAFAGIGGGESDGGTSSRVFGTFLTWMQERKKDVFIIATSNDITKLPPEFLRAGRWDDIWFVDLPTIEEREAIVEVMKKKFKNCNDVDAVDVSIGSENYTGAEIEQAFVESMFSAFSNGKRKVTTKDICAAVKARVPLSKTMEEKIQALRDWAQSRARLATKGKIRKRGTKRAVEVPSSRNPGMN